MKHDRIGKAVYAALFAALVFAATQCIRIPLPFGYCHAGDSFVLLAAWLLGGPYAAAASAVGAVLADVVSGYLLYVPATALIKALMAFVMAVPARYCHPRHPHRELILFTLGAAAAEGIMVVGYLLYDMLLYGLSGALSALSGNLMQGIGAICLGLCILTALSHSRLLPHLRRFR